MTITSTPKVLDCGHERTPTEGLAAGYARRADNSTMCYPCADEMQRAEVLAATPGDKVTLYLNTAGTKVITWSGGEVMDHVVWGDRHNWSRERSYLTAYDTSGRMWYGTGAPGMWCTLKLSKNA